MPNIDQDGMLVDSHVISYRIAALEHGTLKTIRAIVVHQTDSATAQATLSAYQRQVNGAHFLIDKDGQIYQTASLYKRCYHVGALIKSKCLTIDRTTCDGAAMARLQALSWTSHINAIDKHERSKSYPDRYPTISDSIGIELVGKSLDKTTFESVTSAQNMSLQWIVDQIYAHYKLTSKDVYRHPDVSYKNPGEASSAIWR